MPTIIELSNSKVQMFAGDHVPPHFHLRGPNSNAMVRLDTLTVMRGKAHRRDLEEAIAWARANIDNLLSEWSRLNER
ncbi:DUF4160 domain-containing protein [Azospirillum canadense]|uniref:DUF4160 domain-containing protein n=1 Tax=Azospirillum canadense TaxID=403962 RepID=UPI002227B953|nr:DUF4160 domain-containing protein [Azospirillum canadense]MCW2242257.1 hypothetical protein [Azospirillum canadense]